MSNREAPEAQRAELEQASIALDWLRMMIDRDAHEPLATLSLHKLREIVTALEPALAALPRAEDTQPAADAGRGAHHTACDPGFGPANYRCHPACRVAHPQPVASSVGERAPEGAEDTTLDALRAQVAQLTREREGLKLNLQSVVNYCTAHHGAALSPETKEPTK